MEKGGVVIDAPCCMVSEPVREAARCERKKSVPLQHTSRTHLTNER